MGGQGQTQVRHSRAREGVHAVQKSLVHVHSQNHSTPPPAHLDHHDVQPHYRHEEQRHPRDQQSRGFGDVDPRDAAVGGTPRSIQDPARGPPARGGTGGQARPVATGRAGTRGRGRARRGAVVRPALREETVAIRELVVGVVVAAVGGIAWSLNCAHCFSGLYP